MFKIDPKTVAKVVAVASVLSGASSALYLKGSKSVVIAPTLVK